LLVQGDLVAVGVLSANRNFEGRVNPMTRANYLASPPLVVAYALAGTVLIDFETESIGLLFLYIFHENEYMCIFKILLTQVLLPAATAVTLMRLAG